MPNGHSLLIGLNAVDPKHYDGWSGPLRYAEADAGAMRDLAYKAGFDLKSLPGPNATRQAVLQELGIMAFRAQPGDLVLVYYSGHGGFVADMNGDEPTGEDQTWCLYDGQLIDDELWFAWSKFQPGVRILLISDSCHSGTVARAIDYDPSVLDKALKEGAKHFPWEKIQDTYAKNLDFYEELGKKTPSPLDIPVQATLISLSACKDEEFAYEDLVRQQSHFTWTLLNIWNNGTFSGNYHAFFDAIAGSITKSQTPQMNLYGEKDPNFEALSPFTFANNQAKDVLQPSGAPVALAEAGRFHDEGLLIKRERHTGELPKGPNKSGVVIDEAIELGDKEIAILSTKSAEGGKSWDRAHNLFDKMQKEQQEVQFVEPDFRSRSDTPEVQKSRKEEQSKQFLSNWPHPEGETIDFLWHLGKDFSELAAARDSLMKDLEFMKSQESNRIRIAHFDTGYFKHEWFTPEYFNDQLARSFAEKGNNNAEDTDHWFSLIPEQQGHGTATLCILAGPKVTAPKGLEQMDATVGAVPFAEIVPVRIQDSVALFSASAFAKAVRHAIDTQCDVISMSMAGSPSKAWQDAINEAYMNGITIVSAAGNSWRKGVKRALPKYLLYPARFERVIGAAGITFKQLPYWFDIQDFEEGVKTAGGEHMQGNHGPDEQMWHILSAYTPNVIWAETGADKELSIQEPHFIMTGGGTSSATPQVAAAAALWIAKYRNQLIEKGYHRTWKQVEAVRYALFKSAQKFDENTGQISTPQDKKGKLYSFLGQGAVRAEEALKYAPPADNLLKISPPASSPSFPFIRTLFGLLKSGPVAVPIAADPAAEIRIEMLSLELAQLCIEESSLFEFGGMDWENMSDLSDEQLQRLRKGILDSPLASNTLKSLMKNP